MEAKSTIDRRVYGQHNSVLTANSCYEGRGDGAVIYLTAAIAEMQEREAWHLSAETTFFVSVGWTVVHINWHIRLTLIALIALAEHVSTSLEQAYFE